MAAPPISKKSLKTIIAAEESAREPYEWALAAYKMAKKGNVARLMVYLFQAKLTTSSDALNHYKCLSHVVARSRNLQRFFIHVHNGNAILAEKYSDRLDAAALTEMDQYTHAIMNGLNTTAVSATAFGTTTPATEQGYLELCRDEKKSHEARKIIIGALQAGTVPE